VTSGYGIVEAVEGRLHHVASGGFCPNARHALPERLLEIYQGLMHLIQEHRPQQVVLETQFFARNAQTALKLGQARGIALLAAAHHGLPVFEYSPAEIKQAVVGYGRAEKQQVQHMVRAILGLRTPLHPPDAADALAAAICHLHTRQHRIGETANR